MYVLYIFFRNASAHRQTDAGQTTVYPAGKKKVTDRMSIFRQ